MTRKRGLVTAMGMVATIGVLWACQDVIQRTASTQTVQVPVFEVDPFWPKALPNNWRLGSAIGVAVDDQDLVWIVHRSSATLGSNERAAEFDPPQGECCSGAPPILAFDQEGNLVHAWGDDPGNEGAGYTWPESNHGIHVDHEGYVWIGSNGFSDSHILKFTRDGQFVAQFGQPGARVGPPGPGGQPTIVPNSHDPESFGRVTKVWVDPEMNEVYVGDGYVNRRVAVLDATTGEMRRYWGAYGNEPDDDYDHGSQGRDDERMHEQFRTPVHCADVSDDGLVYVCDRAGNRVQVFQRDGTFVQEAFYAPRTLRSGSVWDLAFSSDPDQRYLFVADGINEKIRIIDRATLQELTNFGAGGRQPGQFYGVHSVATDSQGNIYTTETYEGKRVQRFLNRGMGSVPIGAPDQGYGPGGQGVPWPASAR